MRSIGSRSFVSKVELMKWSNRMDLIAFSNERGDVIVQRLNWENLWIHPPPADKIKVRGIDWRPDEPILAIGYSTGQVVLLNVENHEEINVYQLNDDITCLSWTQNTTEIHDEIEDVQENRLFHSSHEVFLPALPSFCALSSVARKADYNRTKSCSNKVFNILNVGLKSGIVHMSVFGMLPCGRIDVGQTLNTEAESFRILDVKMSDDFRLIFVQVQIGNQLRMLLYENDTIPNKAYPLLNLAVIHGHILNALAYIDDIIQCIAEAWETALLEMDNKLTKYASTQPDGAVSADFLELLMFGSPSESLQAFLKKDLTEKGLKRLGSSIEISYSTIQQLVIKPLQTGILNICYHLNCVMGMSRNIYYYQSLLGNLSNETVLNAGAFLLKSLELQQAIEQSTRDYKIFWGWLYGVIIRLVEETVPDEVAAVTQQDVIYLAEFLNNFDQYNETGNDAHTVAKKKFNLERVGQYLEDKCLQTPLKTDLTSEWNKLLDQNECLRQSSVIYPHHKKLSLIQEHNLLKQSIGNLFSRPEKLIGESLKYQMCIDIANIDASYANDIALHHVNVGAQQISRFSVCMPTDKFIFIEFNRKSDIVQVCRMEIGAPGQRFEKYGHLRLCHIQFYNEQTVSMLLADAMATNSFIQFPINSIQFRMSSYKLGTTVDLRHSSVINIYDVLDPASVRPLEFADGNRIAVSGSRKMASIVATKTRRIRHYEMEVEDEDDEADMSQINNSLDISKESTA